MFLMYLYVILLSSFPNKKFKLLSILYVIKIMLSMLYIIKIMLRVKRKKTIIISYDNSITFKFQFLNNIIHLLDGIFQSLKNKGCRVRMFQTTNLIIFVKK